MHLEVDDARLLPEMRGLSACFVLPALTVTAGFEALRAVSRKDPTLAAGFHAAEPEHRWTAGRARLPAGLLAGLSGPVFLRLDLSAPPLPRWVGPGAEAAGLKPPQAERHRSCRP